MRLRWTASANALDLQGSEMLRYSSTIVAALGLVFASCSSPTELCSCPPARTSVFVVGMLVDANGAPISGARVYLVGEPPRAEPLPLFATDPTATTGADGAFRGRVYSLFGPGEQLVRGLVVSPTATDTIVVDAGTAQFRYEEQRPDTVSVTIRTP